ncbi:para-nitrobenzyl esterase [Xylariaceae sp. FL0016]|nr:para-nitrobenzyl esterase [Xylariaceae sp. FL0016]
MEFVAGSSTVVTLGLKATMKVFKALTSFAGVSQVDLSSAASNVQTPVALEGYGQFTGTVVNSTLSGYALPKPVDAWLGMDYASQPVGEGRFSPVEWPAAFNGTKAATKYGKVCIQDDVISGMSVTVQDEACLNFNVHRTQGVPMDKKLPVLVWIHGGSFCYGSYKAFDGASFVAKSEAPLVVVNFHYRLNSLGFLPSELFDDEGLLNLGVRDQHFFFQFVQKYIAEFGGDPDQVTIGGRSAGGHSTGIHYFHNYAEDKNKPLFARAIHQSGSVTARAFPNATYPLYKTQFTEYMDYLGCPMDDNAAAMKCLRTVDIAAIRDITTTIYNKYDPPLTWPFQPTQGGPLLEKFGSQSGYDETFHHVPVISSTTTDEGKYYTPGDLETNEDFLAFMTNVSPAMTAADVARMEALYPDPAADASSPFAGSPNSTQYDRVSAAWSDYAYICPGQETMYRTSRAGVPSWKIRFNANNSWPAWQGLPHTSDAKYTWAEPQMQHPEVGDVYHGYLASFVATGDPNTYRWPGSPEWPNYGQTGNGTASPQLVMQDWGVEVEEDAIRWEACAFWRAPERAPRLNK